MEGDPSGWLGASIALVAVFIPSFLLVYAGLPLWDRLRAREDIQAATRGINAAVVGILVAALYDPVWTSAIQRPSDFGLALAAFGLLAFWKWPPWLVVLLAAGGGMLIAEL
jgi:chromate transporter